MSKQNAIALLRLGLSNHIVVKIGAKCVKSASAMRNRVFDVAGELGERLIVTFWLEDRIPAKRLAGADAWR